MNITEKEYERLNKIQSAFEDLYNNCFGLGSFTMTIQFQIDTNDELWIDTKITPTGDPQDDLGSFCDVGVSFQDAICTMIEEMREA